MPDVTCPECETTRYVGVQAASEPIDCHACGHVFSVQYMQAPQQQNTKSNIPSIPFIQSSTQQPRIAFDKRNYALLKFGSWFFVVFGILGMIGGFIEGIRFIFLANKTGTEFFLELGFVSIFAGIFNFIFLIILAEACTWMVDHS